MSGCLVFPLRMPPPSSPFGPSLFEIGVPGPELFGRNRPQVFLPEGLEHRFGGEEKHLFEEASGILPGRTRYVVSFLRGRDNHGACRLLQTVGSLCWQ